MTYLNAKLHIPNCNGPLVTFTEESLIQILGPLWHCYFALHKKYSYFSTLGIFRAFQGMKPHDLTRRDAGIVSLADHYVLRLLIYSSYSLSISLAFTDFRGQVGATSYSRIICVNLWLTSQWLRSFVIFSSNFYFFLLHPLITNCQNCNCGRGIPKIAFVLRNIGDAITGSVISFHIRTYKLFSIRYGYKNLNLRETASWLANQTGHTITV